SATLGCRRRLPRRVAHRGDARWRAHARTRTTGWVDCYSPWASGFMIGCPSVVSRLCRPARTRGATGQYEQPRDTAIVDDLEPGCLERRLRVPPAFRDRPRARPCRDLPLVFARRGEEPGGRAGEPASLVD